MKKRQKSRQWEKETWILEVPFVTLTEKKSVLTSTTQGIKEYPQQLK